MKMAMNKWIVLFGFAALLGAPGCNGNKTADTASEVKEPTNQQSLFIGDFNADSAYQQVAAQVSFGPRVPGTQAHRDCRDYIVEQLNRYGADSVLVQTAETKAFNGDKLPIYNIIASYNTSAQRRILLVAHWDTRPWADSDADEANHTLPIDGANDGASGVGVLLEIARNLGVKAPEIGVDLLFVDAEDYGTSSETEDTSTTWCLGTQHWVKTMPPYRADNKPVYGILLDMVGGRDAVFHYEYISQQFAPTPTMKVWSEAQRIGFGDRFVSTTGGAITDDHLFLIKAGIPTTDIIESRNAETMSFNPTWHTMADNLSNIDRRTLDVVGKTVLNVVYKEKAK